MQLQILNRNHERFLLKEFGMTLEEFKKLDYSQMDAMTDETIVWIECDENSPDRGIVSEVIDSIYGPYSFSETDGTPHEKASPPLEAALI